MNEKGTLNAQQDIPNKYAQNLYIRFIKQLLVLICDLSRFTSVDVDLYVAGYLSLLMFLKSFWVCLVSLGYCYRARRGLGVAEQVGLGAKSPVVRLLLKSFFVLHADIRWQGEPTFYTPESRIGVSEGAKYSGGPHIGQ